MTYIKMITLLTFWYCSLPVSSCSSCNFSHFRPAFLHILQLDPGYELRVVTMTYSKSMHCFRMFSNHSLHRNLTVPQWAPDDITATKQHVELDDIFIYGFCYLQLMFIVRFACRPFSFGQIIKFYALPFM